MPRKKRSGKKAKDPTSSTPPSTAEVPAEADAAPRSQAWDRRRLVAYQRFIRALSWATVVAVVGAVLTGFLRIWIWILALEPIAIGVIIGEAAAIPSSVRHRRPPRWSYGYLFFLAVFAYLLVHVVFWLASDGFPPPRSLIAFLRAAPPATASRAFQSIDLTRQVSLATGGATALKYWLWILEGLLMGSAAVVAYRGGSVRKLKT